MKRRFLALLVGGVMLFQFVALISTQKLEAGYEYRDMSCYELWYERNRIFARKGYCFTPFRRKAPAFRHGDIRRSCALALSLRKDFREFISLENLL